MGRKTALTQDVHDRIVASVREGNYKLTAARAGGVHRNTVLRWLERGEAGEEPYASFAAALDEAEAQAEEDTVRAAKSGGEGWQAKGWFAERRWPERWSGRVRVTVNDHVDALTAKLKAKPELHRQVVDELAREESAPVGSDSAH